MAKIIFEHDVPWRDEGIGFFEKLHPAHLAKYGSHSRTVSSDASTNVAPWKVYSNPREVLESLIQDGEFQRSPNYEALVKSAVEGAIYGSGSRQNVDLAFGMSYYWMRADWPWSKPLLLGAVSINPDIAAEHFIKRSRYGINSYTKELRAKIVEAIVDGLSGEFEAGRIPEYLLDMQSSPLIRPIIKKIVSKYPQVYERGRRNSRLGTLEDELRRENSWYALKKFFREMFK